MTTRHELVISAPAAVPFVEATREIDAPVKEVYRAYTDPALLVQWMGPRNLTMDLLEYDVRIGGRWAYNHRDQDGNTYGFRGVFHDVAANEHITQTFEFDGAPGHVCLERINFEDLGKSTRIRTLSVFQSVEDRDSMVASGMETGVREGYERMEETLGVRTNVSEAAPTPDL